LSLRSISGRDPRTGKGITLDIEDGRIAAVRPAEVSEPTFLSASLVDLQVNGFAGIDLNDQDITPERVGTLARKLASLGVTTFLPTLITASEDAIVRGLQAIAAARDADPLLAHMIPFVHVEGPFISPEDGPRGAHPRDQVRAPDIAEFDRWQAASGNLVGMVTLSPHYDGAAAFIAAVAGQSIHVSIGHTDATPDQVRAAVDAGARLSTHLGNGAAAMLPRHPNFIWTQLADDRLTATFIVDGHHLPADTFRAMLRAKTLDRAVLISDAAALGGMAPGVYDQPIGGKVELSPDGRLSVAGTPYLAGAARSLGENVAIAIEMAGLSLSDSLAMATGNPGRFAAGRGRLEPGSPADLIRFSWQPGTRALGIETTLVMGKEIG
jgi:N-acetylglucosamine-6-phosphate deacetylase